MNGLERSTTDPLLARIEETRDFVIVLVLETWLKAMTARSYDPTALVAGFPGPALAVDGRNLANWIEEDGLSTLPVDADSSSFGARVLLATASQLPSLRPSVEAAIERPIDQKLKSGPTLKLGALAMALMLVASTGFEVDLGRVKIHKEPLTPEMIVALGGLVKIIQGHLPHSH